MSFNPAPGQDILFAQRSLLISQILQLQKEKQQQKLTSPKGEWAWADVGGWWSLNWEAGGSTEKTRGSIMGYDGNNFLLHSVKTIVCYLKETQSLNISFSQK